MGVALHHLLAVQRINNGGRNLPSSLGLATDNTELAVVNLFNHRNRGAQNEDIGKCVGLSSAVDMATTGRRSVRCVVFVTLHESPPKGLIVPRIVGEESGGNNHWPRHPLTLSLRPFPLVSYPSLSHFLSLVASIAFLCLVTAHYIIAFSRVFLYSIFEQPLFDSEQTLSERLAVSTQSNRSTGRHNHFPASSVQ
jgi:hypothetical protein